MQDFSIGVATATTSVSSFRNATIWGKPLFFEAVPGQFGMFTASTIPLQTSSRVRLFKSRTDRRPPGGNCLLWKRLYQLPVRPILRATVP